MSATVEPTLAGEQYLSACDECKSYFGGPETLTRNWAYVHNELHHNGEGRA